MAAIVGDPKNALFALILIALSYPAYYFLVKKKPLPLSADDAITIPADS